MAKNNLPWWLIVYEFEVGEYGAPLYHTVQAASLASAVKKAEHYAYFFYGRKRDSQVKYENGKWYYLGGYVVSLSIDSVEPIDGEHLLSRLSI